MNVFLALTRTEGPVHSPALVNLAAIDSVTEVAAGSIIRLRSGSSLYVAETYSEIKKRISAVPN